MDTLLNSANILNSRYRVLRQLGHGSFGRTYLAQDINRFDELCVLKEFAPQLQGTFALSKAQELFEREAEVLYRLQHPQIPKFRELFHYQHQGKGHLLLVQEYIEGQTYHDLVNNCSQRKIFGEAEISRLLNQLLPVLEYIHSMGVIHRDISPDNLILRSSDRLVVLIDFGSIKEIATKVQSQLIKTAPKTQALSLIGTVLGKSGYAPPEQMETGIVCTHSDLYALAATAVVVLTGKDPQQLIDPNSYQWHWQHVIEDTAMRSESFRASRHEVSALGQEAVAFSPRLAWVLTTMLSPKPSDRFSTATEVRQALQPPSQMINISALAPKIKPIKEQSLTSKVLHLPRLAPKILFFAVLTGTVLLGNFWWLKHQNLDLASQIQPTADNSAQSKSQLERRFSWGEKVLFPQTSTLDKERATAALAQGNYGKSVSLFSRSLKTLPNDPETLIYLNNARIGRGKSHSIAASVPIGSNVNAAQEILRGIAQAQDRVNQEGGIGGIPLKVQIVDDGDRPKVAQQVASSLSHNQEILGVLGHYASDVTLAAAKIYQSAQLVAISPTSTSVKLSNSSPYLFRATPSDYMAARALAEYMLNRLEQKNVAVFYSSQSNYSKSLKSEFTAAVSLGGGRIVREYDLSDANFSAADSLEQAMNSGAKVIMLAANTDTLNQALQVVQVNRHRLKLLGGDDVYTPKTLQVAGELAQDLVLAIPWHLKSNRETEFSQVASHLWRGEVNWRTAMAYDATKALIAAIERHPSRIGVQQALADPDFSVPGASDQIHFLPSGDRLKPIELVKVEPSRHNAFGYEFTPIKQKTPTQ